MKASEALPSGLQFRRAAGIPRSVSGVEDGGSEAVGGGDDEVT